MAQDGQVDTPASADDKKAPEASGGTVTATVEAPPAVKSSSFVGTQMLIDFEAKQKPELAPGGQMLFDFENDGVGITPVVTAPVVKADIAAPAAKNEGSAVAVATAETGEPTAEKKEAKAGDPDISPIDSETPEQKAAKEAAAKVTGQTVQPPKAADAAPVAQDDELDEDALKDTRYRTVFGQKSMGVINEVWGMGEVSDELKEALGLSGKVKKNDKYGLDFHLPNGHTIEWHANLGGTEFIGMRKRAAKFDEDDAHAVAVTAIARGWKAINVHGTVKQKEMMWLHAKLNGLEVANFEPVYSDDPNNVRNRLAKELEARADKYLGPGASAAEQGVPNVNAHNITDAPQTSRDDDDEPVKDTAEAKAEGDASAAKTEGDKPAAKTEGDAPAAKTKGDTPAAKTEGDKPATDKTADAAKPEADAADGAEVKAETSFGKVEPPAKTDGGAPVAKDAKPEVVIDPVLANIIAEQREALKDDPKGLASMDAFEKGVKTDSLAKDGIPPAVADAAKSAGVEIKTKEPATEPAVAAAKPEADKPAGKGGKKPKGRTP